MSYRTINLPLFLSIKRYGKLIHKLIFTANLWKIGAYSVLDLVKYHVLNNEDVEIYKKKRNEVRKCKILKLSWNDFDTYTYPYASTYVPYSYYAHQCCKLNYEILHSLWEIKHMWIEECEDPIEWFVTTLLNVKFDNWLMIWSKGDNRVGNHGIRIIEKVNEKFYKISATLFIDYERYDKFEFLVNKPKSRRFDYMVQELLLRLENGEKISYDAKIYINDYGLEFVKGVVQVVIPEEIWWIYTVRDTEGYSLGEIEYVLGIDVNFDRINMVLINLNKDIVWMYTLWFKNKVTQGYCSKGKRGYVIQELHKVFTELKNLRNLKFIVAVEDPEKLSYLKYVTIYKGISGSARFNRRVIWFKPKTIEEVIQLCKQHSIHYIPVNPKGTTHSQEHEQIMKNFGLDRHTASAYLIAKRGLEKLKQIYKNI